MTLGLARLSAAVKRALHGGRRKEEPKADIRLPQTRLEAIGRLAAGVAHDVNNQLTVIKGTVQSLITTFPPQDSRRGDLQGINATVDRGARLIHQLLTFSQPHPPQPTSLCLAAVVNELAPMLRILLGEEIALQVRTPAELWSVRADRDQIEQVVMNLVANARDATAATGEHSVTLETVNVELGEDACRTLGGDGEPGPYVMLAVGDNGVGMPPEIRERIFEPFFTTKDFGKGTGLGLATVFSIMNQLSGPYCLRQRARSRHHLPRVLSQGL